MREKAEPSKAGEKALGGLLILKAPEASGAFRDRWSGLAGREPVTLSMDPGIF